MRPLSLGAVLVGGGLVAASPARAQEEICPSVPPERLHAEIEAAEQYMVAADLDEARVHLSEAQRLLSCVAFPVRPETLARYARQVSMVYFFRQDEVSAQSWGLLARHTAPDLPWPEGLPTVGPLQDLVDEAEERLVGGPEGVVLAPPRKGGILMDGSLLLEPRARAEIPHLVQVFDKKGRHVTTWWQEGAVFPDRWLSAEGDPPDPPRWWEGEAPEIETPAVSAVSAVSAVDTAPGGGGGGPSWGLVGTGAGLAVVSGVLLGLAGAQQAGLDEAEDADELTRARTRANLMVVGSGLTALGAVGLAGAGLLVRDDGLDLAVHGRF